jgi:glycosyltransferase involved in cell wall biosynthesis
MRCTWIYYNDSVASVGGRWSSDTASVRYRLLIPVQALQGLGHEIDLVNVGTDTTFDAIDPVAGDVIVLSKIFVPSMDDFAAVSALSLQLVRAAKARGQRVVADMSDHHFDHQVYGAYFRTLVQEADLVVASTSSMADSVRQHTASPVHVISDPYEGIRQPARFTAPTRRGGRLVSQVFRTVIGAGRTPRRLHLLWFGHGTNLDTLVGLVPDLMRLAGRYALELQVVTASKTGADRLCEELDRAYAPLCRFSFSEWSVETTQQALRDCDVVVIPSRSNDTGKAVKSPNRMIESVWAGRYVAAHPVPSYREFAPYSYVGDDIVKGIEAAVAAPRRTRRKIEAGQRHIAEHYAPAAIGRQWEAVLTSAAGGA